MGAVLVTGGAGYVGSQAAAHLVDSGFDVVILDDLCTGHAAAVPDRATLIVGGIEDRRLLDQLLGDLRVDVVMHFAALSLVGASMESPLGYFRANVGGALTLIEACVDHRVSKFILSSTAAIFGDPTRIQDRHDEPQDPPNPYGDTKYTIERILRWTHRVHGLRVACLRYFNAAGADPGGARGEDHEPETHLIPLVLDVALGRRDEIVIFGDDYPTRDGTCTRDYVHVSDLAQAHHLCIPALDREGWMALNLGTGRGATVLEVIEAARRITGHPIPARVGPRRPGDPAVLVADPARAKETLGWRPRYEKLDATVATAWAWHSEHPDGFDVGARTESEA